MKPIPAWAYILTPFIAAFILIVASILVEFVASLPPLVFWAVVIIAVAFIIAFFAKRL